MAPFHFKLSSRKLADYGQPPAGPLMVPFVLLNVHETPVQLACVAVKVNALLPTPEVTETPVVGLNPATVGLAPPTHAVEEPLYVVFAAKYASSATAAFLKSDFTCAS